MPYHSPLHPPVSSMSHSWYSSLGGAVGSTPSPISNCTRRRLPQPLYTPSLRRATMSGLCPLHNPITFDLQGSQTRGILMRELRSNSPTVLSSIHGANDAVLAHTARSRITLRILWPGYEHVDWARSLEVYTHTHRPITRSELGTVISVNFARFVEANRSLRPQSYEWHIGDRGIGLRHLILLALYNVFEETWQAEVAVEL